VVCPILIAELRGVLARAKFRRWITAEEATHFVDLLEREAERWVDPVEVPQATEGPQDDDLVALHRSCQADLLVSGDSDLLASGPTTSPSSHQARSSNVSSPELVEGSAHRPASCENELSTQQPHPRSRGLRGWGGEDSSL
jgi:predicted nucleic acid-binding protein